MYHIKFIFKKKKVKIKNEQSVLVLTTREYNLTMYQVKARHKKGGRMVK